MRKLLLASVAMLGGTMGLANVASAQLQTQYPYTPPAGSTPVPFIGGPGAYGTDIPGYGPPLSPGSVTVRLGGRLVAYVAAGADSGRNPGLINGTAATIAAGTTPSANTKLAPYTVFEYARLYPSFDGLAANGLKYGAFLEIRQDNGAAPGGGANGSVGAAGRARGSMYFWRETGYFGTDSTGFVRFGATDQPTSLFLTGTFENFDDGGWNGDPNVLTGNSQINWPFPDQGALYTTSKVVYLSPKFANLVDFGVSWAPGTSNSNSSGCPFANTSTTGAGCDATSSTSVVAETLRPTNIIDGVVRLRTAFGPVGFAATVGGMYSGHVSYNGFPSAGLPGSAAPKRNNLAVFDGGLQATFGGLAVGGHIDYGQFNVGYTTQPDGGRDSLGWVVGASYQFGSAVVGVQYLGFQAPGAWNSVNGVPAAGVGRSLSQNGVAVGGTFTLAQGAYIYLSYLYGQKHQSGVDLVTNTAPTTATGPYLTHNNVQAQSISLGTRLTW